MSVGILLITHSGIGGALLNVAHGTFGQLPLEISQLSVSRDPEPELLIAKAAFLVRKLDTGDGVLVLTDMFGSTPSNVSQGLQQQGFAIRVIAGLNLPMLFRILNYPHLSLTQLAHKAITGGKEGIFEPLTRRAVSVAPASEQKSQVSLVRQRKVTVVES